MGGRGSTRLAIKHPHLFCSLFNQAGNVPRTAEMGTMLGDSPGWDASQTSTFLNGYLGPDRAHYEDNDVFVLLKKNAAQIRGKMRIMSACGTCVWPRLLTAADSVLLLPVPRRLPQLCQPSDWLSACVVQGGRHTPSDLPPLPPSAAGRRDRPHLHRVRGHGARGLGSDDCAEPAAVVRLPCGEHEKGRCQPAEVSTLRTTG